MTTYEPDGADGGQWGDVPDSVLDLTDEERDALADKAHAADPPVWVGADPSPDDIMAAASAVVRSLTEAGVTVKAADVWSMTSGYPHLTIQVDWEGREKAAALLGFTYEGRHRDGTALFDAWAGAVGLFFRTCLTSMSWVEGEE